MKNQDTLTVVTMDAIREVTRHAVSEKHKVERKDLIARAYDAIADEIRLDLTFDSIEFRFHALEEERIPAFAGYAGTHLPGRSSADLDHFIDWIGAEICDGRDADAFRRYDHKNRIMRIYWLPILAMARRTGSAIDALAYNVMLRAWALAFLHCGRDCDGNSWSDSAFSNASLSSRPLTESLAAYWAHRALQRKDGGSGSTEGFQAHIALLGRQRPKIYHGFFDWLGGYSERTPYVQAGLLRSQTCPLRLRSTARTRLIARAGGLGAQPDAALPAISLSEDVRAAIVQLRRSPHGIDIDGFTRRLNTARISLDQTMPVFE
ncbi:MAG: hypothetical protein ACI96M_000425 [Candidatus Azotimanducaceae bacterium]|jgi:hypothetical protein